MASGPSAWWRRRRRRSTSSRSRCGYAMLCLHRLKPMIISHSDGSSEAQQQDSSLCWGDGLGGHAADGGEEALHRPPRDLSGSK